jgi:hypothetical protein
MMTVRCTSTKDWWKIAEQISNFENKKEIISPIKVNDDLIYDKILSIVYLTS